MKTQLWLVCYLGGDSDMRAGRTLRARLAAATAASILAAVIVFAVVTVLVVGHELRGSLDTALRQRAQDVAQLAVSAPAVLAGSRRAREPGLRTSAGRRGGRRPPADPGPVADPGRAPAAPGRAVRAAVAHGRTSLEDIRLDHQPWRMFVAPIADTGGAAAGGAVLVAANTSDIAHTLGNLGVVVAAQRNRGRAPGGDRGRDADPPRPGAAAPTGRRPRPTLSAPPIPTSVCPRPAPWTRSAS